LPIQKGEEGDVTSNSTGSGKVTIGNSGVAWNRTSKVKQTKNQGDWNSRFKKKQPQKYNANGKERKRRGMLSRVSQEICKISWGGFRTGKKGRGKDMDN